MNNKTAFVWFLFYDAVFEISNYPIIQLNAIAVFFFLISMLCFYFLKIKFENKIGIVIIYLIMVMFTVLLQTASSFVLGAWSISLILSQSD